MTPRVGIISQARMTSKRLPGKVLLEAAGRPMLYWHFARLRNSGIPIYLATTTNATDQPLVQLAQDNNIPFWRGSEDDVLTRFYGCAAMAELDIVVRVTSDCPLIDGYLLRAFVDEYQTLNDTNVYMCNSSETYPRGLDFEIFSMDLLKEAFDQAHTVPQREHVTPYFYEGASGRVRIIRQQLATDKSHMRFTLDTPADFELLRALIETHEAHRLNYQEIIELLDNNVGLRLLNADIIQKVP